MLLRDKRPPLTTDYTSLADGLCPLARAIGLINVIEA